MLLDGSRLRILQRTFGSEVLGPPELGIQIVGSKVYYAFGTGRFSTSPAERFTSWIASADLDDNNWKAIRLPASPGNTQLGYKAFQIVGAKTYFGASQFREEGARPFLGVSGSNIVNKGDAFGIGITADRNARAFVNAGPDYLFRGEAPQSPGGATADSPINGLWHHVAMTYDGKTVQLYIDGKLKSAMNYDEPIASNPFPLIIGDGFRGIIRDVAIYNDVLSADDRSGPNR
jgi:hypothetical protein